MLAGLAFSALTAASMSAGNLLEKHAVDRMGHLSARRAGRMLRALVGSPTWMLGFLVSLAGLAFQVLAFALAPLAVVQSVYGAGLVVLVIAARRLLGEQVGRREGLGLGVIVVAVVLVGVSLGGGGHIGLRGATASVLVVSGATAAIGALALVGRRALPRLDAGIAFGLGSGLFYGVAALGTKGASTVVARHGVLASVPRLLASPYPYLFVAASLLGLLAFQTGLQRARVGVVAPLSSVVASAYVVAAGMALFGESLPHDATRTALRLVGFAGVLAGTALLAGAGAGATPVAAAPLPGSEPVPAPGPLDG